MKFSDVSQKRNNQYLYEGLDPTTKNFMLLWESAGRALVEVNLSAAQVDQVFKQIQTTKGNRTLIGKAVDVPKAVYQAYDQLKQAAINSNIMKNFDAVYDQAAEKLKQSTGGDQGVMQYVQKYRDFAKKHPISQGLIYAALIAAAGVSGAGAGGAAALGLLKMSDKLLQGEKFSKAAVAGAETGALAYAAGQLGKQMKGGDQADQTTTFTDQSEGLFIANSPVTPGVALTQDQLTAIKMGLDSGNQYPDWVMDMYNQQVSGAATSAAQTAAQGSVDTYINVTPGNTLSQIAQANNVSVQELMKANPGITNPDAIIPGDTINIPPELYQSGSPTYAQGVGTAADTAAKVASGQYAPKPAAFARPLASTLESKQLTAKSISKIFERVVHINNRMLSEGILIEAAQPSAQPGPTVAPGSVTPSTATSTSTAPQQQPAKPGLLGKIAGAVEKGVGGVVKGAAKLGRQFTAKVSSDRLTQAWTAAGKPMDSEAIANLIRKEGVSEEVIQTVFQANNIPYKAPKQTAQATPATQQPASAMFAKPAAQQPAAATAKPATAQQTATPAPTATATPAQPAAITVGQINKVIPTLRKRDLESIKKTIDAVLATKQTRSPAAAPAPTATATPAPTTTAQPALAAAPTGTISATGKRGATATQPSAQSSQDATKAALRARQSQGLGAYESLDYTTFKKHLKEAMGK